MTVEVRAAGCAATPSPGLVVASWRSAAVDGEPLEVGVRPDAGAFELVADANVGVVRENGGARLALEVRWVFGGGLPATMVERLGPFPTAAEEREDCYLIQPAIPRTSLKIRGTTLLDLKVNRGSAGALRLRHGGRGRLQVWEKPSFPFDASVPWSVDGSRLGVSREASSATFVHGGRRPGSRETAERHRAPGMYG
jgi:hypothetical protein